MFFNSLHFLVFFPIVVAVYFLTPHRYRWFFLLSASYYFYMCWEPEYALLIMLSTTITYFTGVKILTAHRKADKKLYLVISVFTNLSVLFFFKYFNFFSESLSSLFRYIDISYRFPEIDLLLPVGISFYTFQALSYTIDIYRGERLPTTHFGHFALYISFFPQLVAGPIERSTRLLPQFLTHQYFDPQRVQSGLHLMMWGFFKKIVIADRLSIIVSQVYDDPTKFSGMPLLLATYLFSFQIFCDFSGYSDIAIGAARIFGIELMENFKRPYFSKSIVEFWRRWHISLSTWFRDYVYIPLGGSHVVQWRWQYNIMVVFIISGLWHGANWTFIIWGTLHGFFIIFGRFSEKLRFFIASKFHLTQFPRIHSVIKVAITYHLVLFAWIFFRANSLDDAFYILSHLFDGLDGFFSQILNFGKGLNLLGGLRITWIEVIIVFSVILCLEITHILERRVNLHKIFRSQPCIFQWLGYYFYFFIIIVFGVYEKKHFIYFQF